MINNKLTGIFRIIIGMYLIYKLFDSVIIAINFSQSTAEEIGELIGSIVGLILTLFLISYYFIAGYFELKDRQIRNNKLRIISIIWAGFCFITWLFSSINLSNNYQLTSRFLTFILSFLILILIIKDIRILKRLKIKNPC
jgi:hypothetical protein